MCDFNVRSFYDFVFGFAAEWNIINIIRFLIVVDEKPINTEKVTGSRRRRGRKGTKKEKKKSVNPLAVGRSAVKPLINIPRGSHIEISYNIQRVRLYLKREAANNSNTYGSCDILYHRIGQ